MRLLLVEDDRSLAAGLSLALRNKGFAVNHVARGDHALHAVRTDPPDLMILDLGLPDMDGIDLILQLRRSGVASPVLIL